MAKISNYNKLKDNRKIKIKRVKIKIVQMKMNKIKKIVRI